MSGRQLAPAGLPAKTRDLTRCQASLVKDRQTATRTDGPQRLTCTPYSNMLKHE